MAPRLSAFLTVMKTYVVTEKPTDELWFRKLTELGYEPSLLFRKTVPLEGNYRIDDDAYEKYGVRYLMPYDGVVRLESLNVLNGEEDAIICQHGGIPMVPADELYRALMKSYKHIVLLNYQNIRIPDEASWDMVSELEAWRLTDALSTECDRSMRNYPAYFIPKGKQKDLARVIESRPISFRGACCEVDDVRYTKMNAFLWGSHSEPECDYCVSS